MKVGTCAVCRRVLDDHYGTQRYNYGDEDEVLLCHRCIRAYRNRGLSRDLIATALRSRLWNKAR